MEKRSYLNRPISNDILYISAFIIFWFVLICVYPVSADPRIEPIPKITPTQTLEYHQEPVQNDPLSLYVKQGDTIYLGKTYDLSGASGISYEYAFWSDWKQADQNCEPDRVIDIRYFRTLTNEQAVLLDPAKWAIGNWYYWDSWQCNITHYDYSEGKTVISTQPIQAENNLAFTIINHPQINLNIPREIGDSIPIGGYRPVFSNST